MGFGLGLGLGLGVVPRQPHLHSELDAVRHGLDLVQVQLRLRLAGGHDELRQRRLQLRHGDLVELNPLRARTVREQQLQVQVRRAVVAVRVVDHAHLHGCAPCQSERRPPERGACIGVPLGVQWDLHDRDAAAHRIEMKAEALLHARQAALGAGRRARAAKAPLSSQHERLWVERLVGNSGNGVNRQFTGLRTMKLLG